MGKYDKGYWPYVGEILREERRKRKLSLQDLSDKIGGVKSKQSLMRYENGQNKIDKGTLEAVCRVLALDPQEIKDQAMNRWLAGNFFERHTESDPDQLARLTAYYTAIYDPLKDYSKLSHEHQRQVRDMIQFLLSQESKPD